MPLRKFNRAVNRKRLQRGLAVLLSAWLLVVSAASVSPSLHDWLHADGMGDEAACGSAGCSDGLTPHGDEEQEESPHICAVTLFSQGWVGMDAPAPGVDLLRVLFEGAFTAPDHVHAVARARVKRARAPPVA